MSKLLIDDRPLMVLPRLATEIGLNEAVVLQQIHYWLVNFQTVKDYRHYIEGQWWVYNTAEGWQENFPFWSTRTVQRALQSLRDRGLVQVGNFNKKGYDRTLWYTLDYEAMDKLEESIMTKWQDGSRQNVIMDDDKMATPIPETTTDYAVSIPEKEEAPDGAVPDADFSWPVGDPVEPEPTPTTPPQESILKQKDPISMAAEVARRTGGKASWTVAGPEGVNPYINGPLDATCRIMGIRKGTLSDKEREQWARQLRTITEAIPDAGPDLFLRACKLWPKRYKWKDKGAPYTNIFKGAFIDDMQMLMRQVLSGSSSGIRITNA